MERGGVIGVIMGGLRISKFEVEERMAGLVSRRLESHVQRMRKLGNGRIALFLLVDGREGYPEGGDATQA